MSINISFHIRTTQTDMGSDNGDSLIATLFQTEAPHKYNHKILQSNFFLYSI